MDPGDSTSADTLMGAKDIFSETAKLLQQELENFPPDSEEYLAPDEESDSEDEDLLLTEFPDCGKAFDFRGKKSKNGEDLKCNTDISKDCCWQNNYYFNTTFDVEKSYCIEDQVACCVQ